MSFSFWLRSLNDRFFSALSCRNQRKPRRKPYRHLKPILETLEDRLTPTQIATVASFTPYPFGSGPFGSLVKDSSGNLYGTAVGGGANGDGTVFEVMAGSNTITTLASFNGNNGAEPYVGLTQDSNGNLFGTTYKGGASNQGTVFEVAAGSNTITTLASFSGNNGAYPDGGLVEDSSGNLFGTTSQGGASGDGTVFEVAAGSNTITTLASFNGTNGADPCVSLIEDSSGNLFGTTQIGGASDAGTVFEVASGSNTITTLASFNGNNGGMPRGGLIEDSSGNLFGTTQIGGASNQGTIFEVASGSNIITTLASFNGNNGADPFSGLVEDRSGNLFGTTEIGGASGVGTVFEVAASSNTITTLTSFNGNNGGMPRGGLIEDSNGNLFGTTYKGGVSGAGTVFEVAAGSNTITTLASFNSNNGQAPYTGLVEDGNGNLFGTTYEGGANNQGSVFEVAAGSNTITTLASFNLDNNGAYPDGSLVEDSNGNLFGTSSLGGASGDGTVFEVAAGSNTITTLAFFNGNNGQAPYAGLVEDSNGNLFGTTNYGGAGGGYGTVFEVAAGSNTITTLASFNGNNGAHPTGSLVEDSNGNLFGTTGYGGASGYGTVFEVMAGSNTITTLASFNNAANPTSGLVEDSNGNLFGTTSAGGADGAGTVFEVAAGSNTITTLASFNNGASPNGSLVEDSNGNLFGTTENGGASGNGTVFEVIFTPTVTTVSPNSGSAAGGTDVTITGNDLANATAVYFGTTQATILSDTANQIVAVSPPGVAGPVDITVLTAGGTSATSGADQYTYENQTVSIAEAPASIPISGTSTFTVARTSSAGTLQVTLAVDSSSAIPPGYTLTGSNVSFDTSTGLVTVNFPAGVSSETITFTPAANGSGEAEAAHLLQLDVENGTDYQADLSNNTATVTVAANGFLVTDTSDQGDGSLRQAILNANAYFGTASITFDISTSDSGYNASTGVWTITPASALPSLTVPAILDATTQPGYTGTPVIVLDGSSAGSGVNGLVLTASAAGSTVKGLVIDDFDGNAIEVDGGGNNVIASNYIGVDATGSVVGGNGGAGILISNSSSNTIGGTAAGAGNVISGIDVTGSSATSNVVEGNTIGGTNAPGSIREFPVPVPNSVPNSLTVGPDGNLWFSEANAQAVGKITPQGAITEFSLPIPANEVAGQIISGPNGNLWFNVAAVNSTDGTPTGTGEIVEMTTAGTIVQEFSLPNVSEAIYALTEGPDGNIWFADYYSGVIGRMTPTGQVTYFQAPFGIDQIITGPDGNLWFEASSQTAIGRITPDGDITTFSPTTTPAHYRGLTVGPNGNLWMDTTQYDNTIVEFNTSGQLVAQFPVNHSPYWLTPGPDGNLYFTENVGNSIGMITPQGVYTEIPIPTPDSGESVITAGPGGNMWFSEYGANQIGEIFLNPGNAGDGVVIENGATNNTIGGTVYGSANVIAYNGATGVAVIGATTTGNSIEGNSIHDNTGLGIDLGDDGVTPNGSGPSGPNNLENYPVLNEAFAGTQTSISGTLNSLPSSTFTVDFYSDPVADPSGYGQGQTYLGSTVVTTDSSGNANFTVTLPGATTADEVVTATATDPNGNTSEFAADVTAITNTPPTALLTGPTTGVLYQPLTFTLGASDVSPIEQADPFTYTINWGDGTTANPDVQTIVGPSSTTTTHAFATAGTYTVTLNATAEDGNVSTPVSDQTTVSATYQFQNGVLSIPGTSGNAIFSLTPTLPTGASAYSMKATEKIGANTTTLGTFAASVINIYAGPDTDAVILNGTSKNDAFTMGSNTVSEQVALGTTQSTAFSVGLNSVPALTLNGSGGTDSLTGPNQANTWDLSAANTGTLDGTTAFSAIQNLTGGTVADTFSFLSNSASMSGVINGGTGAETLDFSGRTSAVTVTMETSGLNKATATGGWTNIGNVVGSATATTNTLVGANTTNTWNITGTNAGTLDGTLAFSGFQNLTGGTGSDTSTFQPGASLAGTLNGGSGTNTLDDSQYGTPITVNLQTKTATALGGTWSNIQDFNGTNTTDTLIGPNANSTWTLTGSNSGTVGSSTFTGFANLTGGTGNDTFKLTPTASTFGTIDGGTGTNTLVGANISNTWDLTGTNAGSLNGTLTFADCQHLTGGTGNDTFAFLAGASLAGNLNGGSGTNTLDYSQYGSAVTVDLPTKTATALGSPWANIQDFNGTNTTDTLIGPNATTTWTLTGANAVTVGTSIFSGFANLTAGSSGNDTFSFDNDAGVTGVITGGSGTNLLNYSQYTTGIDANLQTATATGTGGIAKIQNITGSSQGNDILVGNASANVLSEKGKTSGRDLIIGGGGTDSLTAGNGGDILIDGTTNYDTNVAALDALLATWANTSLTYAQRQAALLTGVSYGDGQTASLVVDSTVHASPGTNPSTLTGGNSQDLFFATVSDTIKNKSGKTVYYF